MKRARTIRERQRVKIELGELLEIWGRLADDELMLEAQKTKAISGMPDRAMLIKYLVMDKLDEID
jgi:hypothetical protein